MNTLDTMKARRSIRKFTDQAPAKELVDKVAEAGTWAASGMNRQPAIILEVTDPAVVKTLSQENAKVLEAVTAQIGAMEKLSNESAQSAANATKAMAEAVEASKAAQAPPVYHEISDLDELTERMDQIISLLERSAKAQAKSSSRRGLLFR